MRTLFLKQHVDPFGPWRPVEYGREDPASILDKFYYKPTLWEMTCCLQADWKIVPGHGHGIFNRYIARFDRLAALLAEHQTEVVSPESIDLSAYDAVVSTEACLPAAVTARYPGTLFVYFMNEHDNREYNEQKRAPAAGYDYFLDHMCGATGADLPRSIPMPYLRAPEVVRTLFPREERWAGRPRIWLDARSIARAALGDGHALWAAPCDRFADALAARHGVDVLYRPAIYRDYYDVQDPSSRDAWAYYAALSQADYFIGVAAAGAGQALCDAASLGLVCLGTPELVYHRMLCVPPALAGDLDSAIALVKQWHGDRAFRASIVASQDAALELNMRRVPLQRLEAARRGKLAAGRLPVTASP